MEERPVRIVRCVVLEALDRVIGHGDGGVITFAIGHGGRPIVDPVSLRAEIIVLVVEIERAVEATGKHRAIDVPLAAVVAAVSGGFEQVRQQAGPWLPHAAATAGQPGQGVAVDLLRVVAGEQGTAGRPTACGVVKAGEAQAIGGEVVQMGSCDFPAVATEVRIAQIIGEDEDDIRAGCRRHGRMGGQEEG